MTAVLHDALGSILPIGGWSVRQGDSDRFYGGADPILPTPFRVGAAGAATLAATGLAAVHLWELRTGRCQDIAVDVRQATASLRSGRYLKVDERHVSAGRQSDHGVLFHQR